jgi:hypothetical protein
MTAAEIYAASQVKRQRKVAEQSEREHLLALVRQEAGG